MLLSLTFLFVIFLIWIVAYVKKYTLLSIIAGAFWFLFAMHEYTQSAVWDFHRGFAMLGGLLALVSWILPLFWRQGMIGEEEQEPESGVDRYIRRRNKVRDAAHKIRGEETWEE